MFLYAVCELPRPWPPTREVLILPGEATLWATPRATLLVRIPIGGDVVFGESQILSLSDVGSISIGINLSVERIVEFTINGKPVDSYDPLQSEPLDIETLPASEVEELATEAPGTRQACSSWMNWRTSNLLHPTARANERILSLQEQEAQLRATLEELRMAAKLADGGNEIGIRQMSRILPTLILFKDPHRKSYNPLLLRLAGIKDLPLPMFAMPGSISEIPLPDHIIEWASMGEDFGLRRGHPNQVLVDIQEVLQRRYIKVPSGEGIVTSFRDLLEQVRNKESSHFDESIPVALDELKTLRVKQRVIHALGEAVLVLGQYVLSS